MEFIFKTHLTFRFVRKYFRHSIGSQLCYKFAVFGLIVFYALHAMHGSFRAEYCKRLLIEVTLSILAYFWVSIEFYRSQIFNYLLVIAVSLWFSHFIVFFAMVVDYHHCHHFQSIFSIDKRIRNDTFVCWWHAYPFDGLCVCIAICTRLFWPLLKTSRFRGHTRYVLDIAKRMSLRIKSSMCN